MGVHLDGPQGTEYVNALTHLAMLRWQANCKVCACEHCKHAVFILYSFSIKCVYFI